MKKILSIGSRLKEFWNSFSRKSSSEREFCLCKVGKGYARTSVNTSIYRQSSIISHGDFQFISFYDRKGRIILGKRLITEGDWILKRQPFTGKVTDAHNIISIGVDGEGFVHIAYGMHGTKLRYTHSVSPLSLDMLPSSSMDGQEEARVTYPEFYSLPDGNLLFVCRSGVSGNGNMVMKRYSVDRKEWNTVQLNLIDGDGERNAYWQMCVDKGGIIHVSWVWRETGDVATNHDLCYACSKDGGLTWEKSDGSLYGLPINIKNAEIICPIPQNSELINQTSMSVDKEGHPYIATYWREHDSMVPHYRIVWNNGEEWRVSQVGKRKTPFTLSGGGTKMVPISRPVVLIREQETILIFRDVERDSKVSVAVSSDLEGKDWDFYDLTDFSVSAWEPTFDENLWNSRGILHLFVQTTYQGDGEKVSESAKRGSMIWIQDSTTLLSKLKGERVMMKERK